VLFTPRGWRRGGGRIFIHTRHDLVEEKRGRTRLTALTAQGMPREKEEGRGELVFHLLLEG